MTASDHINRHLLFLLTSIYSKDAWYAGKSSPLIKTGGTTMNSWSDTIAERLDSLLDVARPVASAAWIVGSRATGRANPFSDTDVLLKASHQRKLALVSVIKQWLSPVDCLEVDTYGGKRIPSPALENSIHVIISSDSTSVDPSASIKLF